MDSYGYVRVANRQGGSSGRSRNSRTTVDRGADPIDRSLPSTRRGAARPAAPAWQQQPPHHHTDHRAGAPADSHPPPRPSGGSYAAAAANSVSQGQTRPPSRPDRHQTLASDKEDRSVPYPFANPDHEALTGQHSGGAETPNQLLFKLATARGVEASRENLRDARHAAAKILQTAHGLKWTPAEV